MKKAFGHLKVIAGIPVELGSKQMISLHGLVDSYSTGTIIHPLVLKHINCKIEQGM